MKTKNCPLSDFWDEFLFAQQKSDFTAFVKIVEEDEKKIYEKILMIFSFYRKICEEMAIKTSWCEDGCCYWAVEGFVWEILPSKPPPTEEELNWSNYGTQKAHTNTLLMTFFAFQFPQHFVMWNCRKNVLILSRSHFSLIVRKSVEVEIGKLHEEKRKRERKTTFNYSICGKEFSWNACLPLTMCRLRSLVIEFSFAWMEAKIEKILLKNHVTFISFSLSLVAFGLLPIDILMNRKNP